MSDAAHVSLILGWDDVGDTAEFRRNSTAFGVIKALAAEASREKPLRLNAFFYAYLCPAKNFDLFLEENVDEITSDIADIESKMGHLEAFEREAEAIDKTLRKTYLAVRHVAARANARDEQRTMAVLLFNGFSTADQLAMELGISENLAERCCRALHPVITEDDKGRFALKNDNETLASVLYLVRATLGLDPVSVLKRRIAAASARSGS